ncbi:hypothetical protein ACNNLQ_10070, partial [Aerococcus urinaeequi]
MLNPPIWLFIFIIAYLDKWRYKEVRVEVYKENLDIEKATRLSGLTELCCFWKVSLAHSLFDSYLPIITSGI